MIKEVFKDWTTSQIWEKVIKNVMKDWMTSQMCGNVQTRQSNFKMTTTDKKQYLFINFQISAYFNHIQ